MHAVVAGDFFRQLPGATGRLSKQLSARFANSEGKMLPAYSCTVIVVGYHGEKWLSRCLETLVGAQGAFRLIFADNGGNGNLEALPFKKFDHDVIQTPRPLGFAEANN